MRGGMMATLCIGIFRALVDKMYGQSAIKKRNR